MDELNRDLSKRYGVPVEFDAKLEALAAIARALDRGDLLHAHIATLHLQIPDPPSLANATRSASKVIDLAKQLHASGLLKRGWDPSKHPRCRPEDPTVSADASRQPMRLRMRRGVTNQALRPERRRHCQYRLRP